jgi:hypothetical protein
MTEQKQDPKSIATGCGILTFIFIVICIMIYTCGSDDEKKVPPSPPSPKFNKESAYIHAQLAIEERLKSPASAQFNIDYENDVKQTNDTTFYVKSFVDSQNGFGAMIRASFKCEVIYHPKTDMVNTRILKFVSR